MKRVEVKEPIRSGHDFRHLQLEEWRLADIILKPGLNKIAFSDSLWSVSSIPLLVDQVEVSPPTP
jgi:hypothetical protein